MLARVRFTVALPSEYKGTHMSRFLEILMPWSQKPLAEQEMEQMLEEALTCLHAQSAEVELSFKYFVDKQAPVSGRGSILDLDCLFTGRKQLGERSAQAANRGSAQEPNPPRGPIARFRGWLRCGTGR